MTIYWGEEPIHKMNEPPCGIECDGDWEQDNTANYVKIVVSEKEIETLC